MNDLPAGAEHDDRAPYNQYECEHCNDDNPDCECKYDPGGDIESACERDRDG